MVCASDRHVDRVTIVCRRLDAPKSLSFTLPLWSRRILAPAQCVWAHTYTHTHSLTHSLTEHDKMRSGADLNGDNLQIYRVYLWISDHCRVTVRVMVRVRVRNMVRVWVSIRVSIRVRVADCCIQTAGKSDKMRINHVIKTDQW